MYKYAASVISSDTVSKRRTRMRLILGMSRGREIRGLEASRSHRLTERNSDVRCGTLGLSVTHFTREGGREGGRGVYKRGEPSSVFKYTGPRHEIAIDSSRSSLLITYVHSRHST